MTWVSFGLKTNVNVKSKDIYIYTHIHVYIYIKDSCGEELENTKKKNDVGS